MAKWTPDFLEPLLNYVPSDGVITASMIAKRALRAKIILDRHTRGFRPAAVAGPPGAHESSAPYRVQRQQQQGDFISIVDIDYVAEDHEATRNYKSIELPFVPGELQYNPESNFVGIASFGRNNPYYQFTGSEDTLTFEIDWLSKENSRNDVIKNCRWIEALTKGDGYIETPHRIKLVWGNGDKLWQEVIWLMTAAPYRLSQFTRGYEKVRGQFETSNLMPNQAYQSVTLKRLTTYNLSAGEIINGYDDDEGERILTPRFF